jgi:tyrosine-protein kinase Etk/Wzc
MTEQSKEVMKDSVVTRNPQFAAVLDNLTQLQSKRASAMQEYTPTSKEIRQIDGQIAEERAHLKQIAETIVSSKTMTSNPVFEGLLQKYSDSIVNDAALSTRVKAASDELQRMKGEASKLPEKERQFTELLQKAQLLRNTYEMLSQKYYTLVLSERSMLPAGQLVSQARPAEYAAYPSKKKFALLYLLLGIMLSAAAALIAEKIDIRIHDQAFVEHKTGLPTLAAIPVVQEGTPTHIGTGNDDPTLLESYRMLRSNIAFYAVDREMRILAVTGPGRGEGKSTTAANLAIALAMDGKRVLIVDCDLRRPSMHRVFGLSRGVGLTNVVTNKVAVENAIVKTDRENLHLLPSGPIPPNAPEILNSRVTRDLLQELAHSG